MAIPPAWTDVWICPFADGHITATGRDAKGRKQYRYHASFARCGKALSGADVEQSYSPSFEKLLALSLIAFIAILGPFHPMISSFLSSSSSVAMKNFSSSC